MRLPFLPDWLWVVRVELGVAAFIANGGRDLTYAFDTVEPPCRNDGDGDGWEKGIAVIHRSETHFGELRSMMY